MRGTPLCLNLTSNNFTEPFVNIFVWPYSQDDVDC